MWKLVVCTIAATLLVGSESGVAQQIVPNESTQHVLQVGAIDGLPIFSSDGAEVGRVVSIETGADGSIKSIRAEINGFLGLGTGIVTILSDQFEQFDNRIVLVQSADQVRGLPGASHESYDGAGKGLPPPGAR